MGLNISIYRKAEPRSSSRRAKREAMRAREECPYYRWDWSKHAGDSELWRLVSEHPHDVIDPETGGYELRPHDPDVIAEKMIELFHGEDWMVERMRQFREVMKEPGWYLHFGN